MTPPGPPPGAKLDTPVFEPSAPDFHTLPNPLPPSPPKPDAALVAKSDAPPKPDDEPKAPLGFGPNDPNPDPDPGTAELLKVPKGDFDELAKAESPDEANAEEDVCCFSFVVSSESDTGFAGDGDLGDASAPNGETVEVLAKPEGFSTWHHQSV
jgi:hypothetical protein